jgi:uncharacterized protein YukE
MIAIFVLMFQYFSLRLTEKGRRVQTTTTRQSSATSTGAPMTTTGQVGANLEQMIELAQRFQVKADEVEQLITDLSRLVGSGGAMGAVYWQGRLADRFRAEWDSVYVRNLRQLADALRDQARYVDDNRRRSNLVLNGIDA